MRRGESIRDDLEQAEALSDEHGGNRYQILVNDFGYSVEEVVVGLGLDDAYREQSREVREFMIDNDYGDPDPHGVGDDHEAETPFGTGDDDE